MGENRIDCHDVTELLPGYVVNALADDERAQVLNHLGLGCQRCQQELGELIEAASTLAEGLAPLAPRPEVKQTLLQRIASEPQADVGDNRVETCNDMNSDRNDNIDIIAVTASPFAYEIGAGRFAKPVAAHSRRRFFLPYVAATLGAMAAGSLVANFAKVSPQDLLARLAPLTPAMTPQWRVGIEKAEQAFGPPRAQLTKFGGNVAEQGFQAAIFYDGLAKQSHIFVFDTPPPAENQQLWLWFVDFRGNILSGGALDYLGQHRAAGVFDIADVRQQLMEAVITSEPPGEHSAPSSPPLGRAHLRSSS